MNIQDKELWLVQHGSIDTYGRSEHSGPYMEWTSWGRLHTTIVYGIDSGAIHRLYDRAKDALYSIIEHIERER